MAGAGESITFIILLSKESILKPWCARYLIEEVEGPGAKEKGIRTVFGKIDTDKSGSITIKIPGFLNKADIINFQVFFSAKNNLRLQELKLEGSWQNPLV